MDPREEEDMIFPDKGHANDITCVSMTQSFLIFGAWPTSLSPHALPTF